jgi:hypothetical protein
MLLSRLRASLKQKNTIQLWHFFCVGRNKDTPYRRVSATSVRHGFTRNPPSRKAMAGKGGGAWIRTRDKDFGDPYDTTSPRPRE